MREINNGVVDSGALKPKRGYKKLNSKPASIKKEMLSPTDKTNFSTNVNLFRERAWRIRNPGINVKKMKQKNCLMNGIFNSVEKIVTAIIMRENKSTLRVLVTLKALMQTTHQ